MAQRLTVTTTLPATNCTQQDVYNTIQTCDPATALVGSGLQILSSQVVLSDEVGYWRQYTKTYTDFSTAATTNSIELFSLPAGGVIHFVKLKHSASFTGGAIATYTISVGIVGTLAKYLSASNVFQAAGSTVMFLGTTAGFEDHAAAVSIKATAVSTGANLSAATAGSVDVWVYYSIAV